jgi:hypothetical protein
MTTYNDTLAELRTMAAGHDAVARNAQAILDVLADDIAITGDDGHDGQPLPQLVDSLQYCVRDAAHWRTDLTDVTLWGDERPAAVAHAAPVVQTMTTGFSADAMAARDRKLAKAQDKAAFPYLYNAAGVKPNYDGRQWRNAMAQARKRMVGA